MPTFSPFLRLSSRVQTWTAELSWRSQARCTPQERLRLLALHDRSLLPAFVLQSPVALRYFDLLGGLAWDRFPDRPFQCRWPQALRLASFAAAYLVKLDQHLVSMDHLRRYLVSEPALAWLLGFSPAQDLPTPRHLSRLLREVPNQRLQFLLDETVSRLQTQLRPVFPDFGQVISIDTKHILAWVKENNPKSYVEDRFNKEKQPKGDPDCKLGCKRRHNQVIPSKQPPPTPAENPVAGDTVKVGEFYWGYASGVAATKVPTWGEFVLAELTQPFNQADVSYFFPLMAQVERRLGFQPKYGAADAAYDAFYIFDYFAAAGGFAAVPFSEKGGLKVAERRFSAEGLPLCAAHWPMPLKLTFTDRTRAIIQHERGKYVCPLLYPQPGGKLCPKNHENFARGGCTVDMPTSIGARLRYTLDRESDAYQQVYRQRTATERTFSQAVELGIEQPHLRNGAAIANQNTLIYVLINLRALQRIHPRFSQNGSASAA